MKRIIVSVIAMIALAVVVAIAQNYSLNTIRIAVFAFLISWVVCIITIVKNAKYAK